MIRGGDQNYEKDWLPENLAFDNKLNYLRLYSNKYC